MTEPENYGVRDRPHLSLDAFLETAAYTFPARGQARKPLRGDYAAHAEALLDQLSTALGDLPAPATDVRLHVDGLKPGSIVVVATMPPAEGSRTKAVKIPSAMEFSAQEIVILRSERNDDRTESALLFVPDDAREFLRGRISEYGRQDIGNQRRPDADRFEVVETVRRAAVEALFVGGVDLTNPYVVWWEIWVREPVAKDDRLVQVARAANLDVHANRLIFPETTVLFVHASAAVIAAFASRVPGAVTEIRRATGTIEPFLERGAGIVGQEDFIADLVGRVAPPPADALAICTLDTGVSAEHPLLAPALHGAWAYDEAWGTDDRVPNGGHGTSLASLALYGDLEPILSDRRTVALTHAIESMKLLPPRGFRATEPPSYGVVTQGAVALVETSRPDVVRSFCLATSATDFPSGELSSWSGALDQIAAGSMPGDALQGVSAARAPKRLVLVATGNVQGGMLDDVMPCQPLEDPAQS